MNKLPIGVLEEKLNDMFYDSLEISDKLEDIINDKEKSVYFLKNNIQYISPFTYIIINNRQAFITLIAAMISLLVAPISVLLPIQMMFFIMSIILDMLSYNFLDEEEKNLLKNALKEIKFNLKHSPKNLFKKKEKRKVTYNTCDRIIELEQDIEELEEKLRNEKAYQIKINTLLLRINSLKDKNNSNSTIYIPTEALYKTAEIEVIDRLKAIRLLEEFKTNYLKSDLTEFQSQSYKCILFKRES